MALRARQEIGSFDLEDLELAVRDAVHRCGVIVLGYLLSHEDGGSTSQKPCECGGEFKNKKRTAKTLRTLLGPVRLQRIVQRCPQCKAWRVPVDESLGVVKTTFTPGLRRAMATCGALICFKKGRELIKDLAGIELTSKDVERVAEAIGAQVASSEDEQILSVMNGQNLPSQEDPSMLYIAIDGTGVPVLRKETQGRKGKAEDGIARTREAKLAAVFTQTTVDQEGNPVRDAGSTSYVGRIETSESFGPRVYTESLRRGLLNARHVNVLGDGAPWIWNLADEHFPGATQIVDFYHADEHLEALAKTLFPHDENSRKTWAAQNRKRLWNGKVSSILSAIRSSKAYPNNKDLQQATDYFEKNQQRMNYGAFRHQGLFIGSGVVEAGCKSIIGQRLKQSGMHWSVSGANAILALRCALESRRTDPTGTPPPSP